MLAAWLGSLCEKGAVANFGSINTRFQLIQSNPTVTSFNVKGAKGNLQSLATPGITMCLSGHNPDMHLSIMPCIQIRPCRHEQSSTEWQPMMRVIGKK